LQYVYGGNLFTDKSKGACRLLFKTGDNAKRVKFTAADIRGFVIGEDSFAVLHPLRVNGSISYEQDFVKVLETGKINLFEYDAAMANGDKVEYYLVQKDGKVETIPNKFKDFMKALVAHNTVLSDGLEKEKFKFKDIRKLIHDYDQAAQMRND
jgi:hypothetical protein